MKRTIINCLIALLLLLGAVGFSCLVHGSPALVRYVPCDYDLYGQPLVAQNDRAFPKLLLWSFGQLDLIGIDYQFWSPPLDVSFGVPNPKSIRRVLVNYTGRGYGRTGDTLKYTRFVNPRMRLFGSATDDSIVTIRRGGAVLTSSANSIIEGRAWIIVSCPTWTKPESLSTTFRLVPEGWHQ